MSAARKRRRAPEDDLFAGAPRRGTLGKWLGFAEALYARCGAALGQVSGSAHDEALYLLLSALGLPLDSPPAALQRILGPKEELAVRSLLRRRLAERVPAAYLTGEAWLGGLRFRVDERVIIPRSYFVEIIPNLKMPAKGVRSQLLNFRSTGNRDGTKLRSWDLTPLVWRCADVCTGSGCLAILLARQFPQAAVDAIDLSAAALEVAEANVRAHRLSRRVKLWRSDVFDAVPAARYDLILSNPPYETTADCDALPLEFHREPRLALDGGADGMAVIRKIIAQSLPRLQPGGRLLIEVGGLRRAIDREFARLKPQWLETEDGADCVCAFEEVTLRRGSGRTRSQRVKS